MKRLFTALAAIAIISFAGACQSPAKKAPAKTIQTIKVEKKDVAKKEADIPTVLDFSASWCPPCRAFAPIFKEVSNEYKGKANFKTIDVDENQALAAKYGVRSIPTVIILDKDQKVLDTNVGFMDKHAFKSFLKRNIKPLK